MGGTCEQLFADMVIDDGPMMRKDRYSLGADPNAQGLGSFNLHEGPPFA